MHVTDEWFDYSSGDVRCNVRISLIEPALGEQSNDGVFRIDPERNRVLLSSEPLQPTRSQVAIAYHLWGRRAEYFSAFLAQSVSGSNADRALVSASNSWTDSRSLSVSAYESELGDRLFRETLLVLRRLLPHYSLGRWDPLALGDWENLSELGNPFLLFSSGRLYRGMTERPARGINTTRDANPISATELAKSSRRLTRSDRFTRALLGAQQAIEYGMPHLAVINVVSVLEWLVNVTLQLPSGRSNIGLVRRFSELLPRQGVSLTAEQISVLRKLCDRRNLLVHESPTAHLVSREEAEDAVAFGRALVSLIHRANQSAARSRQGASGDLGGSPV